MLRICLIIAIVAGLAAGGVSFFKVQEVMKTTQDERDKYYKERNEEEAAKKKALGELKKTKEELTSTKNELTSTQSQLKAANNKATELEKQKTELAANLQRTKADRDGLQEKLSQWDILGVKPSEVKEMKADLAKTKAQRDAFVKENAVLNRKKNELQARLDAYLDPDRPVQLPLGLKGKVLAVDPKYDFIVLDVGQNKGVLERGEMLVNRQGKLVAKVRIASVKENRSIANVVPGWKQDEIMEGDALIASQVQ